MRSCEEHNHVYCSFFQASSLKSKYVSNYLKLFSGETTIVDRETTEPSVEEIGWGWSEWSDWYSK